MIIMTRYIISYRPITQLMSIMQATVGRAPNILDENTSGFIIEFDPPLTATEKTNIQVALPLWAKQLFDIKVLG